LLSSPFDNLTDRHELSRVLVEQRESLACRAGELSGVGLMDAYSDLTDSLVARVFDLSVQEAEVDSAPIAVAAVGGYGRREMAPFSDVDVAFLVEGEEDSEVDRVAKRAFRILTDVLDEAGLKVGYSYRRVDEVEHLPLETQTALLDARCVAGNTVVFGTFHAALRHAIVPIAFVTGHVDGRSSEAGTPFVIEPDVKEGPGGLRDLHAARWIAQISFGLTNGTVWNSLRAYGVLTDSEIDEVEQCREFLSRTRNALHLAAGRALDVLTASRHAEVAAALGFAEAREFIARYYGHAHTLARILSKVSDASLECDLAVEPGVIARNGRLRILDKGLLIRDATAMLRLFQHCQSYHLRFDRDTFDLIAEQARGSRPTPEAGHLFLDVLSRPGAGAVLRLMADAGVLQALIPQFGELMYLVPGDAAHKFTVGEHSLRAVEELEALFAEDDGHFADVFSRIQHLDCLFLAVLLHDVGKLDSTADHAKSGAFRAAKLAEQFGMPEDAAQKVEFLVRNHLKMSETARLRDLGQKRTITSFVGMVGDPQLLDMLFLLTVADSRSVGSMGWSQVQTRFLLELHDRAMSAIRSPDAAGPDIERHRTRVRRELCLANLPPDEVDEHCASMPASYLLNTPPEELASHIGYVRTVREGSCAVETRDEPGGQFTELTVVAMDRAGLLSSIAGVLHALSVDVHAAQIFTRHSTDDIAIDLLYIDFEGRQLAETKKWQVEGELLKALAGEVTVDELLRRRGKQGFKRPEQLTVKELANLSDHHTVLEVRTDDTAGLLYYLTRRISELGLDIHSARIATWGHEARDAFYVTDPDGQKLTTEQIERLATEL
jgi:[protein-PII] uridylyltransferase